MHLKERFLPIDLLLFSLVLFLCFSSCDGETENDGNIIEEIPDVSGDFLVFFGTAECGGYDTSCTGEDKEAHYDWINGRVTITQDEEVLMLDFYDGFQFAGTVDNSGDFSFHGSLGIDGYEYTISSDGKIYFDYTQNRKVISAYVDIIVSGGEVCSIDGGYCGVESK